MNGPCLFCEYSVQHLFILSQAERERGQQLDLLRETLPFPVPVLHSISAFLRGDPWQLVLLKDLVLVRICHLQQRDFAPEILSIVTRKTFLLWAWAFIDGRLGQFDQRPFFTPDLQPTGDYPDYETYLLRAYPFSRDFKYWNKANIQRCRRIPLDLNLEEIEDAYV